VITLLLGVTTITLVSQRQRTVLLNKQIASLLSETRLALSRAAPALDALPRQSSTVAARARSAADLVAQARPLITALRASDLPGTVGTAGQLLRSIDQPEALANTLTNLDTLVTEADRAQLVQGLVPLLREVPAASQLISETTSLAASALRTNLISRGLGGIDDLATLVRLQTHTLRVQEATLQNGRSTRELTAQGLSTARRTMEAALQILSIAKQTLAHTANIDRKTP
jgi:hypothetical protein